MILDFVACFLLKIRAVYLAFPNINSNGDCLCKYHYRDDRLF